MKYVGLLILVVGLSFSLYSQDKKITKQEKVMKQKPVMEKEVKVSVEDSGGEKHYVIRIDDGSGNPEIIEWKGTGELPEEIQKKLDALDIDINISEDMDDEKHDKMKVIKVRKGDGDENEIHRIKDKDGEVIIIEKINGDSPNHGNKMWFDEKGNMHKLDNEDHRIIRMHDKMGNEKIMEFRGAPTDRPGNVNLRQDLDLDELEILRSPDNKKLTVKFQTAKSPILVKLSDPHGNIIYTIKKKEFNGQFEKEFDISLEKSPVLILSIEQGDKVFRERISHH